MLRGLFAIAVIVLVAIALVGGSAAVPAQGTAQFAPPPTPRPDELSLELTSTELSQRLGTTVHLVPTQLVIDNATGHVDLQHSRPLVFFPAPERRRQLQTLLEEDLARIGMTRVKSVNISEGRLLLIGWRT